MDQSISSLPVSPGLSLADRLLTSSSGASKQASIQQVWNAINVLIASGALTLTDVLPIFTGGSTRSTTIQKIANAIALLPELTTLSTSDTLPLLRSNTAQSTTLSQLSRYYNENDPSLFGWVIKSQLASVALTGSNTLGDGVTGAQNGTGSAGPTNLNPTASAPIGISRTSGDSAGVSYAYFNSSVSLLYNHLYDATFMVGASTTANVRMFAQITSQPSYNNYEETDQPSPTTFSYVAFRYSTNVPDTYWMVASAGGGVITSWTSTGVVPSTTKPQTFRIRLKENGRLDFLIDGQLVVTDLANNKGSTTNAQFSFGVTPLSAANIPIYYYYHSLAQRFP